MTKFSIIIPVYNSEIYIRKCLDSINAQTFTEFEVIVINDGSTDSTPLIVKDYMSNDNRITMYTFENSGVALSRQRGITLANGQYLIFVDSDDTINPDLLSNVNQALINHNNPQIIRYQANLFNDANFKDHDRYNYFEKSTQVISGLQALKMWTTPGKKYAVYWLFAFKREIFSGITFPNLKCYEDVALIPILIASCTRVLTINYIGYNYLCNNSTSLTNRNERSYEISRAKDFVSAFNYAIAQFKNLPNITVSDFAFFAEDYSSRLRAKFDSLSEDLKVELYDLFGF